MRAAVLEEFGQPLSVQEVDLAEPRDGEVLVRLEACGVCHTDLYTASGADPSGYAPAVLGLCTVAGVAGKGETLDVVPRLLITGRRVAGSSFGGVKGRDQSLTWCAVTSTATSTWIPSSPTACASTTSTTHST